MPVFLLSDDIVFPPPYLASKEGLLAVGGDLSQQRLLLAYSMGIFPWFSENEPIMWWSPHPRLVLYPNDIIISKSLHKLLKKDKFKVTMDQAFFQVIEACAQTRSQNNQKTWIIKEMRSAYCRLFEAGYGHSVETWHEGQLAGGLYGLSLGKCFFGESMFTRISNASKVALVFLAAYLRALSFDMIDCQVTTQHLMRLGAKEISRESFLDQLAKSLRNKTKKGRWALNDVKSQLFL
jgi:leucyl/phenylalanyl-tRNA--protein transferase